MTWALAGGFNRIRVQKSANNVPVVVVTPGLLTMGKDGGRGQRYRTARARRFSQGAAALKSAMPWGATTTAL